MAYLNLWGIVERGLKKPRFRNKRPKNLVRNKCQAAKDKHMKKLSLVVSLGAVLALGSGCAAFTKGVDTARGTVIGAIDTVKTAVDKGFSVVSSGASAAEKIADSAKAGAVETVTPAISNPTTPAAQ